MELPSDGRFLTVLCDSRQKLILPDLHLESQPPRAGFHLQLCCSLLENIGINSQMFILYIPSSSYCFPAISVHAKLSTWRDVFAFLPPHHPELCDGETTWALLFAAQINPFFPSWPERPPARCLPRFIYTGDVSATPLVRLPPLETLRDEHFIAPWLNTFTSTAIRRDLFCSHVLLLRWNTKSGDNG